MYCIIYVKLCTYVTFHYVWYILLCMLYSVMLCMLLQGVDNAVDLAQEQLAAFTTMAITAASLMWQLAWSPVVATQSVIR